MKISRLYVGLALVGASLVIASCGESSPTAPVAAPLTLAPAPTNPELLELLSPTLRRVGLLSCTPMDAAWAQKRIGSDGGQIRVGPHTLTIPRGALRYPVTITAYAPSSRVNRVELSPHGLEFQKSVSLTMSYANCDLLGSLLPKHVAYVNDDLRILYLLESIDNLLQKKVTGRLDHFSEYAVAW